MKFTGERYLPGEKGEIRLEHMHRYAAALQAAAGKDVIDVACGEGYGSRLLASVARSVVGVDVSAEAIAHANRAYAGCKNLKFKAGAATELPLPDASFDVAVSFETIEHLEGQREMLAELRRVLRPKGVLILSSPNRPVYSPPGEKPNEFHVRELDFGELDQLLREHFPAVQYFGQRIAAGSVLQPIEGAGAVYKAWCDDGSVAIPQWAPIAQPVYFFAVCAARESQLPKLEASFLQSSAGDILEDYRNMARWARQADEEILRNREVYSALDEEHRKVASWAHSLEDDLGAERQERERVHQLYQGLEEEHRKVAEWAQSLDADLARAREEHERLEVERQKVAAWGQSLEAELAMARQEHKRLDEEHHKAAAWGQSLDADLAKARTDRQALEDEHAKVAAWAQTLDAELTRERGERFHIEDERGRAIERAAALEGALERADRERERLAEQLRIADAQARELEERLESTRSESAALERQHGELRRRQEALDADFARLRIEMLRMESEYRHLSEAQAPLEATIAAFRDSFSWKVTYPIRAVGAMFGALARTLSPLLARAQRLAAIAFNALPIDPLQRARLRVHVYSRWPGIAEGSPPYEAWKARLPWLSILRPALLRQSEGEGAMLVAPTDRARTPRVSVIVPVYGQLDYTLRCIQGLIEVQTAVAFEIIVVDDRSPDVSLEVLSCLPQIRLVSNPRNEGFIRSCNRGAAEARGDFVVFLNNDTIVQPDWLNALVRTFEDFPDCGLAGSKLLYPDGRLQEAGGIIWNDGSGWNYGRLDDPDKPQYNYVRDVDYCSGASIMLRTELFRRLGGFDEHYLPAYGEDSDLAFRVRRAGLRVLYQPFSRVVHFEGVTSGTDLTQGVKAYQVANAKKLVERWKAVLAAHGEPGRDPHLVRDRNIAGRVLVIDHCTPTPDQDAGSITALNLMRILQELGMKVTFVPEDNMLFMEKYTTDLQRLGIECLYHPHVANLERHLTEFGHVYDAILLFRVGNSTRHLIDIEYYCPQAKLIFHPSDLHFYRFERQAEVDNSPKLRRDAAILKERELATIRRADATIVHSSTEKQLLDDLLGWKDDSRIFVLGWSIEIPRTKRGFRDRDGIVFVGGYQHGPNVDAVDHFVQDIFPIVRKSLPKARFLIVGSRAPSRFADLGVEGVEYVGFVEDLGSLLDKCRLSVAPLRYGAGTKGKVYTSLAHGLPCVASTIGAEGMNLGEGEDVLVADHPADFAAHVVRLHEDEALWNRLSQNGYAFLEAHASMDVGREVVTAVLDRAGIRDRQRKVLVRAVGTAPPIETRVSDRGQYEAFMASAEAGRQRQFEEQTIRRHSVSQDWYDLEGWCEVCEMRTAFRVDMISGGRARGDGFWEPNWRERCSCHRCQLNTRQRVIAARVRDFVRSRPPPTDAYLTEQVTPIFQWLTRNLPAATWTGSEFLGFGFEPGFVNDQGIRHENVEGLSFPQGSFDLVVSNDVLEHVDDPERGLAEMFRVLRPGGVMYMTVPFHTSLQENRRRAKVTGTGVVHYLPEVYHGNPMSEDGSLVFVDFGWELLDQMRRIGFGEVALHLYWAEQRGYYGVGQHYIKATKPL